MVELDSIGVSELDMSIVELDSSDTVDSIELYVVAFNNEGFVVLDRLDSVIVDFDSFKVERLMEVVSAVSDSLVSIEESVSDFCVVE